MDKIEAWARINKIHKLSASLHFDRNISCLIGRVKTSHLLGSRFESSQKINFLSVKVNRNVATKGIIL